MYYYKLVYYNHAYSNYFQKTGNQRRRAINNSVLLITYQQLNQQCIINYNYHSGQIQGY